MKTNGPWKSFALALLLILSRNFYGQQNYFVPVEIPKAQYTFDLIFDFENGILQGKGTLSFTNSGARPLQMIAFDYAVNDHHLLRLSYNESELKIFSTDGQSALNNPVYFTFHKPVMAGETVSLDMEFKRRLFVSGEPEEFEHQNLIPRLRWDGIQVSEKFRIKINDLPDYTIAVSGRLNTETGYYENDNVQNFGFFLSKKTSLLEEEINGVMVQVIYPENGLQVAEVALQTAREAIPYYIDMLGMYPYSFLNIIPGGPGVWGGYPFASGMVVIHGMQLFEEGSLRHWKWITAHEIGHEYWGEYVLDGDDPPWLWIALGIYADREFSRHIGLSDIRHRAWAEKYLNGIKKGFNTTLDIRPAEEAKMDFDRNNYVIHAKGFSFISALEIAMGKDHFRAAYRDALGQFGGEQMGYRDFQKICEKQSGEKLDWFFEPWVRSNHYLSAVIGGTQSEHHAEGYTSTVSVYHDGDLIMPVPVYANFDDGSVQVKMTQRISRKAMVHFDSKSPIAGASIDPTGCLANMTDLPEPGIEEVLADIQMLPYSGAGEKTYRIYRKARLLSAEDIGEEWYKLGMSLFDGGYYPQSETAFGYGVKYGPEEDQFINYCWLGHIQDIRGKRSKALASYQRALDVWNNDSYTHSQYNMEVDKAWVQERLDKPFSPGIPLSWDD